MGSRHDVRIDGKIGAECHDRVVGPLCSFEGPAELPEEIVSYRTRLGFGEEESSYAVITMKRSFNPIVAGRRDERHILL